MIEGAEDWPSLLKAFKSGYRSGTLDRVGCGAVLSKLDPADHAHPLFWEVFEFCAETVLSSASSSADAAVAVLEAAAALGYQRHDPVSCRATKDWVEQWCA